MELRHLRYFRAVAEELHFGRAAQRLGIRQPPLSQQIRALEADLGVSLFDRNSRRVQLTAAGEALHAAAGDLLASVDAARLAVRRAGDGETGELVLGFVGSATNFLLPLAVRRFRKRYPHVALTLLEMTTAEQIRALHDGALDVGLLRPPLASADEQGLELEVVGAERLVVAMPADHSLAGERSIAVDRLAHDRFVHFPRSLGPGLYDQISRYCQQNGFTPLVVQEAVQMQTIVALVAAGLGVALVPSSVARLRRSEVVYRSLVPAARVVHLAAARRSDNRNPVGSNLFAIIRELSPA